MQSLFPMPTAGGRGGTAVPTPLIQLKAGKCTMQLQPDGKYLITPDKRKGRLTMIRASDGLLHFRWENRVNNQVEDDSIIFPGDAVFKKVKTGRDTDRVYILSLQTGPKLMYWLQDLDASKDNENLTKINEIINNPNATNTTSGPTGSADFARMLGVPPPVGPTPVPPALNGLDLSSILGAFNNPVAPVASSSSAPTTSNAGRLTAAHLQQALAGTSAPSLAPTTSSSLTAIPPPRLEEILTTDAIMNSRLLEDPEVRMELIHQLPEGQQSEEFLEENIRSAQFQQSLGALSDVLQSDGGNGVTSSFGIDPSPGMAELIRGDAVGAFLTSIQAAIPSQPQSQVSASVTASSEEETTTTTSTDQPTSDGNDVSNNTTTNSTTQQDDSKMEE